MISTGCISVTVLRFRQVAKQPVGSLAGLRGCADDGAVVFAQHLKLSAAAHNVKESGWNAGSSGFLTTFLRIISERVEPRENACVAFPRGLMVGGSGNADLLQCLAFCFEVGSRVVVRRIEAHVTEPATDNRDVDAR
jgi:hypothetical protein